MKQESPALSDTVPWPGDETPDTGVSADERPLRSELFSAVQMAQHGRMLAGRHRLAPRNAPDRLLQRLAENAAVIADACDDLTQALAAGRDITPASEWLLDNNYLIGEQIRLARRHLPRNYSRQLPRLADGEPGVPRVYQLALEVVAHGDGHIDPESLSRFVAAYQETAPLQLGELWAIPIMLRLALIENLRRVAASIARSRMERDLANEWADRMTETAERSPARLILLVADMARSEPPLTRSFVAELSRRLQGQSAALATQWLASHLSEADLTVEQLVQAEIAHQAADQVSISNSIGSLRLLGSLDWKEFVETLSPVEQELRLDPDGTYPDMDFATRDMYRHKVEALARKGKLSEMAVAQAALELARELREPAAGGLDPRTRHVGHYLIGDGAPLLEQRLGLKPVSPLRAPTSTRLLAFLGAILAFTALFTAVALDRASDRGLDELLTAAFLLVFAVGASQLAVALVNFIAAQLTAPRMLPRLDFREGLPDDVLTLVVVPCMLYTPADVHELCDALEVRFLANRDANLRFCLLTDFADADAQHMPGDAELLALAREQVDALNQRHASECLVKEHDAEGNECQRAQQVLPFLLLHRGRRWNPRENVWMGYERKRGKLAELNTLLRGGARGSFDLVVGDQQRLHAVRYVITLDSDTLLPRGAARKLVATMAHPLNQAQVAADGSRVVAGYGILQPRMAGSMSNEDVSRYEQLCGDEPGIDPYTRTVSDVYQDLFAQGSFIGKGIYDVDVFERVLGNRLPENLVLSHDLLEGCYLRAGLLSDQLLFEQHPARYSADVSRRHRWVRGDWQIAGWLRPTVAGPDGQRVPNPLTPLSRWKVLDNLRRSLVAPALTALLVMSWPVIPVDWFWTAAVLAAIFVPPLLSTLFALVEKPNGVLWPQHWSNVWHGAAMSIGHAGLSLVFLPYEAFMNLDAILRTGWRMLVSRRRLLEWRPSSLSRSSANLQSNARNMWVAPLLAVVCAVALQLSNPAALLLAGPFLLAWLLSPMVAWWVSLPLPHAAAELAPADARFLHKLARRTWSFFETFVTASENWLPPDNMQEHPTPVVAHRTSPTNIGMSLLSNLAAWDFGYITTGQLAERCAGTLATMGRMERYQGHLLNWYDTLTLEPLLPRYVSSVDSGNLAGHLLTLAPGLEEAADAPLIDERAFRGIASTLDIVDELAQDAAPGARAAIAAMHAELARGSESAGGLTLPGLADRLALLLQHAQEIAAAAANGGAELEEWCGRLHAHCAGFVNELDELAPWAARAGQYLLDSRLTRMPTLRELAAFALPEPAAPGDARNDGLARLVGEGATRAVARIAQLESLARDARAAARMDFTFMYNKGTRLLSIGYNVTDRRLDASAYDLLASEIRLASFVAIAQGQLPEEHWFALGRQLCYVGNEQVLLSWSGSMFEYLMPLLVMPSYRGTLLDHTYRAAVRAQAEHGRRHGVPWGISESGYNTLDAGMNYQYHAFGVPGLGMKRGLGDDLVIAPYATMLGLMVDAELATRNLQRMAAAGFMGRFGFYEAIDFTQQRLPRGHEHAVVRSFMAHHQGMGFAALDYVLSQQPMQRRFESDPELRATLLVLQERVPKAGAFHAARAPSAVATMTGHEQAPPARVVDRTITSSPQVQLLSNGRYHVMVSSAGGGYSRWKGSAVTRWREDGTRDNWGSFCYVRDVDSGAVWSTTFQPTLVQPDGYEAVFAESRAEFRRHDGGIDLYTEVVVSPEDDIEMRRTRVTNNSGARRTLELTSYAEVVMAPHAQDASHPAFAKLFVQTEILPGEGAILCERRPRRVDEPVPCMLHLASVHDVEAKQVSFETSRAAFIGRGNDCTMPAAMRTSGPLGGASGAVLDPVVAIRCRLVLEPGESATVDYVTGMADERSAAQHLIDKYQDRNLADRVFELAWTHSQVVLRQLNASEAAGQLYASLAASIVYPQSALRADPSDLVRNQRGQSGLWAYAISGDLPIVLLLMRGQESIELARQMVQAHAYWRLKGLQLDLVIWYQEKSGYRQELRDQIIGMVTSGIDAQAIDRPGGIFVRAWDQVSPDDQILMLAVARVVIDDARGPLADQVVRASSAAPRYAPIAPEPDVDRSQYPQAPLPMPELQLFNGIGGFTSDGREYVIRSSAGARTPAPWSNVLANPTFGSIVSESGQAYTWSENAHEFRLTPWHNDPVSDISGEAFYIRDEQSGRFWSPTALPAGGSGDYISRHGFGYSVFEHAQDAIHSELTTFVAPDAALKYTIIRVRNDGPNLRQLSVTGYVEWVLGDMREKTSMHIVTELDAASGALFARNAYNQEFGARVGFFHVNAQIRTVTGDRTEFVGRTRSLANPAAMRRRRLSGRVGPALDPCGAFCAPFALHPGEERELVFVLGVGGRRIADAARVIESSGSSDAAWRTLGKVREHWERVLGAVQVTTPDPALDALANGWLMYQTIACRMWARSGYYQSSGAFGYRDQLQDAMATVHTQPQLLRDQLLLCAAHQFAQGDVQHWWHPPSGRGVRTHCSDDYLWLPYAAARYIEATGDVAVLSEQAGWLEGRELNQDEESYYDLPGRTAAGASLYEHCVRAIRHGLRVGPHGLPLIGTCDWNDGMDRVGDEGRGESVWLGWFLIDVLKRFGVVAQRQGDHQFEATCREHAVQLAKAIEEQAWDGDWYRRAYFDDGTPLGSAENDECRIDSISQSWGVLSGAADPARARIAMEQVDRQLVRREARLVQLLDPPFDKGTLDPGYIRGYVPGVRENGGQYTHAAIWTAMAFAQMGDVERAWELQRMLNPVSHAATPEQAAHYKVEPYVVAADVYAVAPHVGRGGWTWYTGSAGWMYRLIVESLLGIRLQEGALVLAPLLPSDWDGFTLRYRFGAALYLVEVRRGATASLTLDGQPVDGNAFKLVDDGAEHRVELRIVSPANPPLS